MNTCGHHVWGEMGLRGRGGLSFEPLSCTPPPLPTFWAPVTGTPNGPTGRFGGGGVLRHPKIYDSK